MIETKQNQKRPAGIDKAVAEGKLYTPLNGRELCDLLLRSTETLISTAIHRDSAAKIRYLLTPGWTRHPSLDTDVIAYPKADVQIRAIIQSLPMVDGKHQTMVTVQFKVFQHPREEGREFGLSADCTIEHQHEGRPLPLEHSFNLDDIPPDALRILNNMPVPTPTRTPGSGPAGESTVVDLAKPATEEQKAAVEEQFLEGGRVIKGGKK